MPRAKKSRKPGQIGARKDPEFAGNHRGKKKPAKGNPSGSRQHAATAKKAISVKAKKSDPRIGSKKPIALVTTETKRTYATPAEELAALEADTRLTALLDKVEREQSLRKDQQRYVDEKLARHAALCELLGIDKEEESEDDPFHSLDAISLSDFDDSDDS